jgi:biuret amidohydrolase
MSIDNTSISPEIHPLLSGQHAAVLVCDAQNDFCSRGGKVYDRAAKRPEVIASFVQELVTLTIAARDAAVKVIFIKNTHLADAADVSTEHMGRLKSTGLASGAAEVSCIQGSWGHQVVDALRPRETDVVIEKSGFNIFQYSMLDKVLRAQGIEGIVLTGISSYAGVLATNFALMDYGYHFIVPRECVTGYDSDLNDAALKIMGPRVVGNAALTALWGAR